MKIWCKIILCSVLLLVIYVPITLYVVIVTNRIPFPYFNPRPRFNPIPIQIFYPDMVGLGVSRTGLIALFVLDFNETIAENTPIQIANATGQILAGSEYLNVSDVEIGFKQAIPWNHKDTLQQGRLYFSPFLTGLHFIHFFNDRENVNLTIMAQDEMYFPVAGDYSPTIFIQFFNGTSIQYTYNEIKVHVLSASEIEAVNTNRLNLAVTYVLLFFSYIQGFVIVLGIFKFQEKPNIVGKPEANKDTSSKSEIERMSKPDESGIDRAFDTFILLQTLIFATIFSYLTWLSRSESLTAITKIVRVFFIPILIIVMLWIFGHLLEPQKWRILFRALAWYWSFLSFTIQALFLGEILLLDILSPQLTVSLILMVILFTPLFGLLTHLKFKSVYHRLYSSRIQIASGVLAIVTMIIYLIFVLITTP